MQLVCFSIYQVKHNCLKSYQQGYLTSVATWKGNAIQ